MKAAVVVFPGTTCDFDAYDALKEGVGVDTEYVFYQTRDLSKYSLVVLPGGFTYGDYLRSGAIASRTPILDAVRDYVEKEWGFVVGICNGFQILTESRILPGALTRNHTNAFICKPVGLRIANAETPFTEEFEPGERLSLPIAHADGRYVADPATLQRLHKNRQIFLVYDPENPNGSVDNIAGITNEKQNVFGLMPHPERFWHPWLGSDVGIRFFRSLVRRVRHG